MASLDAPPTLAQVVAEHYDRELQVAPSEREIRRRDLEHAAVIERQQALAQLAPGVAVAWQLTRGLRLPAIPLHPRTLEPVGEAITDPLEVLEHWQANPTHAVGVRWASTVAAPSPWSG